MVQECTPGREKCIGRIRRMSLAGADSAHGNQAT